MSPVSYVLMWSSYNLGSLVSCFRFHMPPIFVYYLPSNGGDLLLPGTTVVGSGGFGESFWVGDYFKVLF